LLALVNVKILHTEEVYTSLDPTEVKYSIKGLSIDEKKNVQHEEDQQCCLKNM
jgi:hypothetical protein